MLVEGLLPHDDVPAAREGAQHEGSRSRLGQPELDLVRIEHGDVADRGEEGRAWNDDALGRPGDALVGRPDVLGGEVPAVVELHAFPEVETGAQRTWQVPPHEYDPELGALSVDAPASLRRKRVPPAAPGQSYQRWGSNATGRRRRVAGRREAPRGGSHGVPCERACAVEAPSCKVWVRRVTGNPAKSSGRASLSRVGTPVAR